MRGQGGQCHTGLQFDFQFLKVQTHKRVCVMSKACIDVHAEGTGVEMHARGAVSIFKCSVSLSYVVDRCRAAATRQSNKRLFSCFHSWFNHIVVANGMCDQVW